MISKKDATTWLTLNLDSKEQFFWSKNEVFGPVQIPKQKNFFKFFSSIAWAFVPVPNAKKWYFSDLVPVLKVNL